MDGGDGGGRRGSCCMAHPDDISKAERIMLKFRPIAPKPAPVGSPVMEMRTNSTVLGVLGSGRKRRRYRKNITDSYDVADKNKTRSGSEPEPELTSATKPALTPVLPQLSLNKVSSIVTVENLTSDTCVVEEYGLGYSDGERMHRLNVDTCPGFVSDWFGRVIWTNGAYKELVGGGGGGGGGEMVSLMMKEGDQRILMIRGAAFTCRVRLQYYGCRSMTIPCDAWRMDCGGFAWRLDIKAALSL